jgi:hypothetical protein
MADIERSVDLLSTFVQTEEDRKAFEAGYDLASNPENRARFSGMLGWNRKNGLAVTIEDRPDNSWTAERNLPRALDTVLVYEPAFVLGAVCAAFEKQWVPQESGI